MTRTRLFPLTVLLALFALAPAARPAPASALPRDFWGAVPQSVLDLGQLRRLKRGGVDAIRLSASWAGVQSSRNADFDWSSFDPAIEAVARAHIDPVVTLWGAPDWAVPIRNVPGSHGSVSAPLHLPAHGAAARGWMAFAHAAVARYGTRGTFWGEHPDVPRRPVRVWQIWNEPNFKYFVVRPRPAEYGRLVKRSAGAIRSADRRATIILGGLFARPREATFRRRPRQAYFATDFLRLMYRHTHGVKSKFDGIALHPYAGDYRQLAPEIEEVREVLRESRDRGAGLWITELGWSSKHPTRRNSFAKGLRGQAAQLRGAFKVLRRNQHRWRLRGVYWFSVDDLRGACNFCDGSGLFHRGFRAKPAWRAYRGFAR